jgi:CBS domain-containing protein
MQDARSSRRKRDRMSHRKVRDVMTTDVVTVPSDMRYKDLAALLSRLRVSAVPVLGPDGRVAGVVSEVDLLRKEEYQEDSDAKRAPRWRRWTDRARARGRTAAEVMSSPAITVAPDVSVVAAARLLDRHHVRRLLVAEVGGRLAGIVTPHDLLRVYLRSDEEIRDEIVTDILVHYLATNPALAKVTVTDGVVTLAGELGRKSMIPIAIRMTQAVDGVVDVVGQLRFAVDDTHLPEYVDTSMD